MGLLSSWSSLVLSAGLWVYEPLDPRIRSRKKTSLAHWIPSGKVPRAACGFFFFFFRGKSCVIWQVCDPFLLKHIRLNFEHHPFFVTNFWYPPLVEPEKKGWFLKVVRITRSCRMPSRPPSLWVTGHSDPNNFGTWQFFWGQKVHSNFLVDAS